MKFQNNTEENIKFRLGSYKSGFDWHSIRPGEIADIPQYIGEAYNLTPIEEEAPIEPQEDEKTTEDQPNVGDEPNEEESEETYFKRLVSINGVGKKTASDVINRYPTEDELIQGIEAGDEIHIRDDIDAKIKAEFE